MTRDDLEHVVYAATANGIDPQVIMRHIDALVAAAVAAEREKCAIACDEVAAVFHRQKESSCDHRAAGAVVCRNVIRARATTTKGE